MSGTEQSFRFSSDLQIGVNDFLSTMTLEGVNAELSPLAKMTAPSGWADRSILDCPQQQPLFKSWILFLGILPVDRHEFYLASIKPGEGFIERSSSVMNALWRHERTVIPLNEGCRVTDTVAYRSRLMFVDIILKPVYRLVFWCRHRHLRQKYSGCAS
jgi:hypothetical protein